MKNYKLGNIVITTTEKRYESTFKALGYEPVEEVVEVEKPKKSTKKEQPEEKE